MNFTDIIGFLRKPASGSDALRQKLTEVAEAIPTAETEAERLAAERAAKLLDASDKELEAIEKAHADSRRAVDRLRAAQEELTRRLAAAEAIEASAKLDADRAEVERIASETAARVAKVYPRAAREIAALVEDLAHAEAAVVAINARLIDAGRADEIIPEVEQAALPLPAALHDTPFRLRNSVSLPPCSGFDGLGRAREAGVWAGVVREQIG